MKLIVGTDSSWSLRAWICVKLAKVEVTEQVINLSCVEDKNHLSVLSATHLVPVLQDDGVAIHDSLAIAEYLNEKCQGLLYPDNPLERAHARSLCAELHSGFLNLRSQYPFILNKSTITKKPIVDDALNKELTRLSVIFSQAHLPYMYQEVSVVDAFYAILAYRLECYGFKLAGKAGQYQQSLLDWSILQEAIKQAKSWSNSKCHNTI